MVPVHHDRCVAQADGDVHKRILDTDALVRTTAKDKIVARVAVREALGIGPAVGVQHLWLRVNGRIVQ